MSTTMISKDDILEAIGKMSVLDLADLIEAFKTKFNVTVVAAGAAPAAAAAPAAEEQTEFAVILKSGGEKTGFMARRRAAAEASRAPGCAALQARPAASSPASEVAQGSAAPKEPSSLREASRGSKITIRSSLGSRSRTCRSFPANNSFSTKQTRASESARM